MEAVDNYYMITARGEGRELAFGALEKRLVNAAGVRVRHVMPSISSVAAFVYDFELLYELREAYDVLPQYKSFKALEANS